MNKIISHYIISSFLFNIQYGFFFIKNDLLVYYTKFSYFIYTLNYSVFQLDTVSTDFEKVFDNFDHSLLII